MKKLLATDPNNYTALIARLALGITIFPHGAQKLLVSCQSTIVGYNLFSFILAC